MSAGAYKPQTKPLHDARGSAFEAPLWGAAENARSIFLTTFAAACAVLAGGTVLFGWRALWLAALCVVSSVVFEKLCFKLTRMPSLVGRSHACLTGLLLALTLPPFAPWYAAIMGSAFAIVVGKAVFGGVGHFLWQPALVGRLAVAVLLADALAGPSANYPQHWPVLAQEKLVVGDVAVARRPEDFQRWRGKPAPPAADAFLLKPPSVILAGLTSSGQPQFSALVYVPQTPAAKPALLAKLPPLSEVVLGAYGGGIGETCFLVIVLAGLYLIYRNYVKWQLPVMFILLAGAVAAVAPIRLAGPAGTEQTVWWPLLCEGLDAGLIYVCYQVLSGAIVLSAFFLATEMTSRPVTSGGQVIFGAGCGALAMFLKLYMDLPIAMPAYMAVLAMNTFTPMIDSLWRPRVLGRRRLWWLLGPLKRRLQGQSCES